jgi:hypothetical protein
MLTCLSAGAAGCAAATVQPAGSRATVRLAGSAGTAKGGCPRGRLLPAGQGIGIDYIDFVRFGGRSYDRGVGHVTASQLGRVVTRVRCSLTAEEDHRRDAPPIIDRTASFLPVGAPLYAVRGYPVACRLAAYQNGKLQVYLALAATRGQAAATPLSCAVGPTMAKSAPGS